jgi:hypothetical protein
MFVLRAEIVTMFGSKMVTISARNTNIYKTYKLRKALFPYFTTFREFTFCLTCKLSIGPTGWVNTVCGFWASHAHIKSNCRMVLLAEIFECLLNV